MARAQQPFRKLALEQRDTQRLQESILDWLTRQWVAEPAALGAPISTKHEDYSAKSGEIVPCAPPAAGMTVFLPKIDTDTVGMTVGVAEVVGSTDTITVRPGDTATIAGAATATSTTAYALTLFVAVTPTLWVKK